MLSLVCAISEANIECLAPAQTTVYLWSLSSNYSARMISSDQSLSFVWFEVLRPSQHLWSWRDRQFT